MCLDLSGDYLKHVIPYRYSYNNPSPSHFVGGEFRETKSWHYGFSEFSHFILYRGNIIYPYCPLLTSPCLSRRIYILNALELLLTRSISSLANLYYPDVFRTYAPIPSNTLQAVAITACTPGSVLIKSIGRRPPRPGI